MNLVNWNNDMPFRCRAKSPKSKYIFRPKRKGLNRKSKADTRRSGRTNGQDCPNTRSNFIGSTHSSPKPDWSTSSTMTCSLVSLPFNNKRAPYLHVNHRSIKCYHSRAIFHWNQKAFRKQKNTLQTSKPPQLNEALSDFKFQRSLKQGIIAAVRAMAGSWRARGSLVVLAIVFFGEYSIKFLCTCFKYLD